jgi:Zn-dependent metalloprotease
MQNVNGFNKIRHINESPRNKNIARHNGVGIQVAFYLFLFLSLSGCVHSSVDADKHNKEAGFVTTPKEAKLDNATIHYRDNGTPSLIKGDNLSYALDGEPGFQELKKENLYQEIVYRFLESQRGLLMLNDPRSELKKTQLTVDDMGFKHIKVQQVVNEVPIWGREIIIHLNRDNEVYMVNGYIEPSVTINTTPKLTNREAAEHALEAVPGGSEGWHAAGSKIQVFFAKPDTPRLVYVVTLAKGIVSREYYFIDAKDGTFLHKISGTPSLKQKSPPGYEGIKLN